LIEDIKKKIMQGRYYQFDLIGKAFGTLPLQDSETNNLLTSFDLYYSLMSKNIAGFNLNSVTARSSPGVYICSTDVLFIIPHEGFI
jgi:hypothetical protein